MKQRPDRPPDLLILGLSRCALDSDEVISRLRAWPAIPVIVPPPALPCSYGASDLPRLSTARFRAGGARWLLVA